MNNFSEQETAVYSFILQWMKEYQYPPSYREILAGVGSVCSVSTICAVVKRLREKGVVAPGRALPIGGTWTGPEFEGYSSADDKEWIEAEFQARYGYPPAVILRNGGATLAGPIEEHPNARAGLSE